MLAGQISMMKKLVITIDSRDLLSEEEMDALLNQSSSREDELKMDVKLKLILDFPLEVAVRLGQAQRTVGQLLNLTAGTVIELDTMIDEPVELVVNGKIFAGGDVVTVGETFGIRLKTISKPEDRIESLR